MCVLRECESVRESVCGVCVWVWCVVVCVLRECESVRERGVCGCVGVWVCVWCVCVGVWCGGGCG